MDELNNNHFEIIKEFSLDKDALLRSRCAALLINFQTDDSLKLLLHLCSDTDDLVRAEAYDSLGAFVFPKVERTLFKSINSEKNTLPLEYAIFSWADVSSKLHNDFHFHISFIKKLLQKNKSEEYAESQIRLACCYALQLFGCNSIYSMIQFLNHEEYLIRCSALNLLYDVLNKENEDLIKSAVLERLNNEETIAVKCEAEKFFQ